MMARILTTGLACAALCICAVAQPVPTSSAPGTNFPALAGYPDPACARPGPLPRKPATINAMDVDRYNALLGTYNKSAHDYVVCINLYVRNADSDMDLIRRKSRDAVEAANR
jgi:hypothetical protein